MSGARTILVNPPQGGNADIANVALGFIAAAHPGCAVVDLNTFPSDPERLFRFGDHQHSIWFSVQSRSRLVAAELMARCRVVYPQAWDICSIVNPIRIQCSYPFVDLGLNGRLTDKMPDVPDYSGFDSYPLFAEKWSSGAWPYAVFTSWGCPYGCAYCAARRTQWRARRVTDLVAELLYMHSQIRVVMILDEVFNLHHGRVLQVCVGMKQVGLEWMCTNGLRADLLCEVQARTMQQSGCTTVGFGIECASDAVLKAIKKGETVREIERGIGIAKQHFSSVSGYFIIGLPQSTYDLDRRSMDWAIKQGIYIHASYYVPLASGATFYGTASQPAGRPDYPAEQQAALMQAAQGLSWGQRDVGAALRARWRLARGYGLRAAGRYLRMDAVKAWRRARR